MPVARSLSEFQAAYVGGVNVVGVGAKALCRGCDVSTENLMPPPCVECWESVVLDYTRDLQDFGQEAGLERNYTDVSIVNFLQKLMVLQETFIRVYRYFQSQWGGGMQPHIEGNIDLVQKEAYDLQLQVQAILQTGEELKSPLSLSGANWQEFAREYNRSRQILPTGYSIKQRFQRVAAVADGVCERLTNANKLGKMAKE